jgi:hypothetical protein
MLDLIEYPGKRPNPAERYNTEVVTKTFLWKTIQYCFLRLKMLRDGCWIAAFFYEKAYCLHTNPFTAHHIGVFSFE